VPISAFNAAVTNFLLPSSVHRLDLSAYCGQPGQTIMDSDRHALESGSAVETMEGSGAWVYTATGSIPAGTNVQVWVVARDRPGGTGMLTESKTL
jgi:hypothetical protein